MVKNPFISQDIFAHPRTNVCTSIAQDNHGHRCVNNGQYKLSAENLFIPPSIKTLHATERGKLKLCSDVKFDLVSLGTACHHRNSSSFTGKRKCENYSCSSNNIIVKAKGQHAANLDTNFIPVKGIKKQVVDI